MILRIIKWEWGVIARNINYITNYTYLEPDVSFDTTTATPNQKHGTPTQHENKYYSADQVKYKIASINSFAFQLISLCQLISLMSEHFSLLQDYNTYLDDLSSSYDHIYDYDVINDLSLDAFHNDKVVR